MDMREEGKVNMMVNDKDTTLDSSDGLRKQPHSASANCFHTESKLVVTSLWIFINILKSKLKTKNISQFLNVDN